jgi:hypothetical protein
MPPKLDHYGAINPSPLASTSSSALARAVAPNNPWEQEEARAIQARCEVRDRERDRAPELPDRSTLSLEDAAITPTPIELRVATLAYKRTIINGTEYSTVLALAKEYANQSDVKIRAKRLGSRGADIYEFEGACPFCQGAHHNAWVAINQPRFPDTTLLQCLKTNARRSVSRWPF